MNRFLLAAVAAVLLLNPHVTSEQVGGQVSAWYAANGHWPGVTRDEFGIKTE